MRKLELGSSGRGDRQSKSPERLNNQPLDLLKQASKHDESSQLKRLRLESPAQPRTLQHSHQQAYLDVPNATPVNLSIEQQFGQAQNSLRDLPQQGDTEQFAWQQFIQEHLPPTEQSHLLEHTGNGNRPTKRSKLELPTQPGTSMKSPFSVTNFRSDLPGTSYMPLENIPSSQSHGFYEPLEQTWQEALDQNINHVGQQSAQQIEYNLSHQQLWNLPDTQVSQPTGHAIQEYPLQYQEHHIHLPDESHYQRLKQQLSESNLDNSNQKCLQDLLDRRHKLDQDNSEIQRLKGESDKMAKEYLEKFSAYAHMFVQYKKKAQQFKAEYQKFQADLQQMVQHLRSSQQPEQQPHPQQDREQN